MSEPLHLALAGCGRWGRLILRDLKSLGCRVTVVARSEASRANAGEFGADATVGAVGELPDGLAGAVVAVVTTQHAAVIESLLPLGIPVFTEKPLANRVEDARRLVAMGGGRLFVMDKWRYHPGIEALAAMAHSGDLGPIETLRLTRYGWAVTHDDVDAVWVLAPHDLSIALEILGDLPLAVSAVAEPDASGLTAVLGESPRLLLSISARHPRDHRSVSLCCREGTALLDDSYAPHLLIRRRQGGKARPNDPVEQRPIGNRMPLLAELAAFCEYLKGGPPPRSSATEGLRIVERIASLRALAGIAG